MRVFIYSELLRFVFSHFYDTADQDFLDELRTFGRCDLPLNRISSYAYSFIPVHYPLDGKRYTRGGQINTVGPATEAGRGSIADRGSHGPALNSRQALNASAGPGFVSSNLMACHRTFPGSTKSFTRSS
jgi:hypothetical protein